MIEHCVHTKDHLLGLLNESNETDTQLVNVETVMTVLEHTEGLWIDTRYCYKAKEIANRCDEILRSVECTNHKRKARIETMKRRAWALSDKYHGLHQEYMQHGHDVIGAVFNIDFPYKTNEELAS